MTRADMDLIAQEFVDAAIEAREAGFDAIEIHMGHGYLLSQFISPFYNKRRDEYGGDIQRRMKFPAEVLAKVLEAVGKDLAVLVKISQTDGRDGGNGIEEGIEIARILEKTGAHMTVLSNGMNVEAISGIFGSSLPKEVSEPPKNPVIRAGLQWQKISELKRVEFSKLYLLPLARQIRKAVTMPLCYLGGVQDGGNVQTVLDEGFEAIALGRILVYDPEFVNKLEQDRKHRSGCTACNQCVTMMYSPAGTFCIEKGGLRGHEPKLNMIPAGQVEASR